MRGFANISVRTKAALAVACVLTSAPVRAQSPEAAAAADRLMAAQNVDKMLTDMATATAANFQGATDAQKQAFISEMTDPAFVVRFKDATRGAMARHFTVDELNALADFYSRPVAQSAMAKMGPYTGDVMKFVQSEIPAMVERIQKKQ